VARLILLISLVPVILSIVVRKYFCDRGVRLAGDGDTSRTGRELADLLLGKAGVAAKVGIEVKRRAEVKVNPAKLHLTKRLAEAKNVLALGEVALLCGHAVVAIKNPDLLKWRQWAVRFSWAFPVFTLVVVVFAVVVAKMPPGWGIAVAMAALGLGSGMALASLQIEIQASQMMAAIIDESRIFPRLRESESVAQACKALAYRHAVPGAIEWLMGKEMERKLAKEVGKRVARKVVGR
jgi:hypothetical protein